MALGIFVWQTYILLMIKSYLQRVTQSAFTALTVADMKTHLNVSDNDTYIGALLNAAVAYCEKFTQLDFRSTSWRLYLESFPFWGFYQPFGAYPTFGYGYDRGSGLYRTQIHLLRGPLTSVSSIQYYDTANTLQTLASDQYVTVSPSFFPGVIEPVTVWPVAHWRPDSVQITYTTGLAVVPDDCLMVIRLLVGSWYNSREDISYGPATASGAIGCAVENLLGAYRVQVIG